MTFEIVVADPAKNITLLVLNPVENRAEAAKLLLAEQSLHAEQVGFVIPPKTLQGLWRLEMMGGEFCGNGARSFGLFVARTIGLSGNAEVTIEVSGMKEPLPVRLQVEKGTAEVRIPKPLSQDALNFQGQSLPAYRFDGITHLIAPGIPPEEQTFFMIKRVFETRFPFPQALGVLFFDQAARFMVPAVYVYHTDSLIFESSCGSGSAALGLWLEESRYEGESRVAVPQPGGIIEVQTVKKGGAVLTVAIGGTVALEEPRLVRIDPWAEQGKG
ncbi:MAG: hypothetical protein LBD29_07515 [Treponema sp.]|jgi:diaminopimelate epimerase|nr:hypothetical protein [Treponema sp.]